MVSDIRRRFLIAIRHHQLTPLLSPLLSRLVPRLVPPPLVPPPLVPPPQVPPPPPPLWLLPPWLAASAAALAAALLAAALSAAAFSAAAASAAAASATAFPQRLTLPLGSAWLGLCRFGSQLRRGFCWATLARGDSVFFTLARRRLSLSSV